MSCSKLSKKFIGQFGAELCPLVGYQVDGGTKATNPFVEYGFCHCGSFFVFQCSQFDVFGEGICDAQDELFTFVRSFQWAE